MIYPGTGELALIWDSYSVRFFTIENIRAAGSEAGLVGAVFLPSHGIFKTVGRSTNLCLWLRALGSAWDPTLASSCPVSAKDRRY